MSKRLFHLENFKQHYPAHHLNEENYGISNEQVWPLLWYWHTDEEEHYYYIKTGWKLLGISKPPFPSRCEGNTKAFVAENEKGEVYWWHFTPKTVVINPNAIL